LSGNGVEFCVLGVLCFAEAVVAANTAAV
jgi:hypothetical protein